MLWIDLGSSRSKSDGESSRDPKIIRIGRFLVGIFLRLFEAISDEDEVEIDRGSQHDLTLDPLAGTHADPVPATGDGIWRSKCATPLGLAWPWST